MAHTLCFCQAELFIVPSAYAVLSTFHKHNGAVGKSALYTQTAWVQSWHGRQSLQGLSALRLHALVFSSVK